MEKMSEREFEKALAKVDGVTDVYGYTLIANYGWTFQKSGYKFDVRFWANCYGTYIGDYDIHGDKKFYQDGKKFQGETASRNLADILETIKAI